MKILVAGLGLIGGSLCKAIKNNTEYTVIGDDNNENVIKSAIQCDAVDEKATDENIPLCDIAIICLHPQIAEEYMNNIIPKMKKNSIISDVCGIKGSMVHRLTDKAGEHNVHYIGTHPMAGKECFGFENSDGNIFKNANFIITPVENTCKEAQDIIVNLAKSIGFGKIVITSPEEHDRTIAYTSQLAHVVSSAYVKSPAMQNETGFSGGSFQDMTRTATMNETMWCNLFLMNKDCLLTEIDTLIENLKTYRNAISENNSEVLTKLIKDGRILKEENIKKRTMQNHNDKN